jgi:hypothetical protein
MHQNFVQVDFVELCRDISVYIAKPENLGLARLMLESRQTGDWSREKYQNYASFYTKYEHMFRQKMVGVHIPSAIGLKAISGASIEHNNFNSFEIGRQMRLRMQMKAFPQDITKKLLMGEGQAAAHINIQDTIPVVISESLEKDLTATKIACFGPVSRAGKAVTEMSYETATSKLGLPITASAMMLKNFNDASTEKADFNEVRERVRANLSDPDVHKLVDTWLNEGLERKVPEKFLKYQEGGRTYTKKMAPIVIKMILEESDKALSNAAHWVVAISRAFRGVDDHYYSGWSSGYYWGVYMPHVYADILERLDVINNVRKKVGGGVILIRGITQLELLYIMSNCEAPIMYEGKFVVPQREGFMTMPTVVKDASQMHLLDFRVMTILYPKGTEYEVKIEKQDEQVKEYLHAHRDFKTVTFSHNPVADSGNPIRYFSSATIHNCLVYGTTIEKFGTNNISGHLKLMIIANHLRNTYLFNPMALWEYAKHYGIEMDPAEFTLEPPAEIQAKTKILPKVDFAPAPSVVMPPEFANLWACMHEGMFAVLAVANKVKIPKDFNFKEFKEKVTAKDWFDAPADARQVIVDRYKPMVEPVSDQEMLARMMAMLKPSGTTDESEPTPTYDIR